MQITARRKGLAVTGFVLALQAMSGQSHPPLTESEVSSSSNVLSQRHELHCYQQVIELYDQLQPALLAHLRGLGLTTEDAEDVMHESFLRLLRHLLEMRADENLRGWLYRVAYNLSMDLHRFNRHYLLPHSSEESAAISDSKDTVDPAPDPENVVLQQERFHRLQQGVMQLTVQQRTCVLLRAEGLRYREIASRLGISVQRVAKLLERSTSQLAAAL